MANNRINKVAVVGATGNIGSRIVAELLKIGRHDITAITRQDSTATFPEGIKVARVDYSSEESLVTALRGHDFLVISLRSGTAPEVHTAICNAAVKAGITWMMPNAWGMDTNNERLMAENVYGPTAKKAIGDVKAAGGNYIQLTCSFWYESLAGGLHHYGIDIPSRKAIFFDDGTQKINTTTLAQCGRAVAALLDLPVVKEDATKPALEDWKDNCLYVSSFLVSQRDMLDSVHRALGTSDDDWNIEYHDAEERTRKALEDMKNGDFTGFIRAMYTRFFFKSGEGAYSKHGDSNYEAAHGLANPLLSLPQEDLDESTKLLVDKVLKGGFAFS